MKPTPAHLGIATHKFAGIPNRYNSQVSFCTVISRTLSRNESVRNLTRYRVIHYGVIFSISPYLASVHRGPTPVFKHIVF